MKKILVSLLTMLGLCSAAMAQSVGQRYLEMKDYPNALKYLEMAESTGIAHDKFLLGFMHANGLGTKQDLDKALHWYQQAATEGDTQAQFCMGFIYNNGLAGVQQNNEHARQWFQKAAQQQHARAQYNLQIMDGQGKGVLHNLPSVLRMGMSACLPQERPTKQQIDAIAQHTLNHLAFIEGGTFMMGDFGPEHQEDGLSYTGNRDARPLHEVSLDSFSIMGYLVTFEEFDLYSAAKGQALTEYDSLANDYRSVPEMAAGVYWQDAKNYCRWLGEQTGLPFDLPTEAQWEYAARNRGQYVVYATDNGKREVGRNIASYDQQRAMIHYISAISTHPIGRFPASPLGLYDMGLLGGEWIDDWYAKDYYAHSPGHNPQGPETGGEKVMRGAYSSSDYQFSTTMTRNHHHPELLGPAPDGSARMERTTPADRVIRCVVNAPQPVREQR